MELCIKSDAKNGRLYQKWLFALSEIYIAKWEVVLFQIFCWSSSFIFNNFKTEDFKATFEGWNRSVCHLFGFTRVSIGQDLLHFTLGQWSESWWRWCWVSFSVVYLFFSSPREKARKLSSFWNWQAESLLVSIIVAKYSIFPRASNGCWDEKKFLAKQYARAISEKTVERELLSGRQLQCKEISQLEAY